MRVETHLLPDFVDEDHGLFERVPKTLSKRAECFVQRAFVGEVELVGPKIRWRFPRTRRCGTR